MPRPIKRTPRTLEALRIRQEREKLLLLRIKRREEAEKVRRRKTRSRDRFDTISGALASATGYPRGGSNGVD